MALYLTELTDAVLPDAIPESNPEPPDSWTSSLNPYMTLSSFGALLSDNVPDVESACSYAYIESEL